ncbi:MAG: formate/nitrite transporter family protein [Candidatus Cloacimonas sp.]|nr:formate/nitrite transporter family protein [Candidatus Cloacimonadota bacterium]
MANFNAPENIAEAVIEKVGVKKCQLGFVQVVLLGILAGAFIAFGAQLATRVQTGVEPFGLRIFLGGAVFSVGLMLVVIAGAELFTGNNLIMMSVLAGKKKVGTMLGYWLIVFIANFIGSLLVVWLMKMSNIVTGDVAATAIGIAKSKAGLTFQEAFFRGILCNWLVCLAVWLALAANDIPGKILGIFFPIMAFVASGFEHSIANMYFIPMGMILDTTGSITMGGFMNNLAAATLGNIVGGAGFVATVYYVIFRKCANKPEAK